jgi:hypothetical protein
MTNDHGRGSLTDIVERMKAYIPGEPGHEEATPEVLRLAIEEIERLRTAALRAAAQKQEPVACQARDKRWNSSEWHDVPMERFNYNPDFEYRHLYAYPPAPLEPQAAPTREAVIEECAKVADDVVARAERLMEDPKAARDVLAAVVNGAMECAENIRALLKPGTASGEHNHGE